MSMWRPIERLPKICKDGRSVRLGWLPNGILEFERLSCWRDGEWMGGWTPTHWKLP